MVDEAVEELFQVEANNEDIARDLIADIGDREDIDREILLYSQRHNRYLKVRQQHTEYRIDQLIQAEERYQTRLQTLNDEHGDESDSLKKVGALIAKAEKDLDDVSALSLKRQKLKSLIQTASDHIDGNSFQSSYFQDTPYAADDVSDDMKTFVQQTKTSLNETLSTIANSFDHDETKMRRRISQYWILFNTILFASGNASLKNILPISKKLTDIMLRGDDANHVTESFNLEQNESSFFSNYCMSDEDTTFKNADIDRSIRYLIESLRNSKSQQAEASAESDRWQRSDLKIGYQVPKTDTTRRPDFLEPQNIQSEKLKQDELNHLISDFQNERDEQVSRSRSIT